ncbi:hypothetical protein C8R43DRAFT_1101073 [Mycena crocata]|nr:hypothetical protein C8R43DRAFT_1101073 [Mycena crocata]
MPLFPPTSHVEINGGSFYNVAGDMTVQRNQFGITSPDSGLLPGLELGRSQRKHSSFQDQKGIRTMQGLREGYFTLHRSQAPDPSLADEDSLAAYDTILQGPLNSCQLHSEPSLRQPILSNAWNRNSKGDVSRLEPYTSVSDLQSGTLNTNGSIESPSIMLSPTSGAINFIKLSIRLQNSTALPEVSSDSFPQMLFELTGDHAFPSTAPTTFYPYLLENELRHGTSEALQKPMEDERFTEPVAELGESRTDWHAENVNYLLIKAASAFVFYRGGPAKWGGCQSVKITSKWYRYWPRWDLSKSRDYSTPNSNFILQSTAPQINRVNTQGELLHGAGHIENPMSG